MLQEKRSRVNGSCEQSYSRRRSGQWPWHLARMSTVELLCSATQNDMPEPPWQPEQMKGFLISESFAAGAAATVPSAASMNTIRTLEET